MLIKRDVAEAGTVRRPKRSDGRERDGERRAALVERLRVKAGEADNGETVDLSGLTDEELLAALSRR